MILLLNSMIFVLFLIGMFFLVSWMWDVGVQELVIYTEHFLLEEAKKVHVKVLPEINSTKLWDRLELSLYYSGIRTYMPFVSGKVWLIFCFSLLCCLFIFLILWYGKIWAALAGCSALFVVLTQLLEVMRHRNLRVTERYLLEFLNVTESFAVTGEEPAAILRNCSVYMKGPIGRTLKNVEKYIQWGWSGRMILEQLKVNLEHPKWQEFIHNINVCSMYNSEYGYVFRSSRKSMQAYLTSKKERQSIKHNAQIEMGIIVVLSAVILWALSNFLMISIGELIWGSAISKICTIYMVGIVLLFFWKINRYEKE